jgi:hypothetical protein
MKRSLALLGMSVALVMCLGACGDDLEFPGSFDTPTPGPTGTVTPGGTTTPTVTPSPTPTP